jgi:alpha-L-fucosidase 2
MMIKTFVVRLLFTVLFFPLLFASAQTAATHNLVFDHLADKWDGAMPLGNGMLGALIWKKDDRLRLSLDRADLWDERKALDLSKFNYKWVEEQVLKKDYAPVQRLGDDPYNEVYPTKLPAAAMEFDISSFGKVISNELDIKTALNTVKFENGIAFNCYIHATEPYGCFSFENIPSAQMQSAITAIRPNLIVHNYNNGKSEKDTKDKYATEGLEKLGYAKGTVTKTGNSILYHQPTYNGHYYEVLLQWQQVGDNKLTGRWTVVNDQSAALTNLNNETTAAAWQSHIKWWQHFWAQSSISIPDTVLEKQYYLDEYKLGSVARKGAPAITLQAVWTADNGSLPPWKGDFHNDLNTQLSYWSSYTGNHLEEAATYTDWLWKIRAKNIAFTKQYFGVDGLNVPGVVTLGGEPTGGWIQYALSPMVGAWCAQYFYWQWQYSMDDDFLKNKAYPYIHDVATYLENITRLKDGVRKLPLSSSPEYNDNDISAWFLNWSNFDLSLAKFLLTAATEVANATGKKAEADHWQQVLAQLPDYEINETGFTVAPGQNLNESHRHMSQYMAIYPLALLDINKPADKVVIDNSLHRLQQMGTTAWCGYSFTWMSCLYARTYHADSAVKQLKIFASNFCSPNSFHLNGDQKGGQYSSNTSRPFTLEGNFAFAQSVHELLLQSRNGYIEVFPAIPDSWKDVSFNNLRAAGGFLISASKRNGEINSINIKATADGLLKVKLPQGVKLISQAKTISIENGISTIKVKKNETVVFGK